MEYAHLNLASIHTRKGLNRRPPQKKVKDRIMDGLCKKLKKDGVQDCTRGNEILIESLGIYWWEKVVFMMMSISVWMLLNQWTCKKSFVLERG